MGEKELNMQPHIDYLNRWGENADKRPGQGWRELLSKVRAALGGTTELDPDQLMSMYDNWVENKWSPNDTSPETFLQWLVTPSSMKYDKRKFKPKSGADDQFKAMFGVREDVGNAQREFRDYKGVKR